MLTGRAPTTSSARSSTAHPAGSDPPGRLSRAQREHEQGTACFPFFVLVKLVSGAQWWIVPAQMGALVAAGLACLPLFAVGYLFERR